MNREYKILQLRNLCEDDRCIIVGDASLYMNQLCYGYSPIAVYTKYRDIDGCITPYGVFEAYHFNDLNYCKEVLERVYLPTPERALVDTIVWLPENCNEGQLIESLQTYQYKVHNKDKLYEVADYYKTPRCFIDYWWKEAEEESDMSMG